jgi:hypothetical protein
MRTAPGRPGTAQLTVASSRAKHAHETLPVGHNTPQEAPQAFAEAVVKAHGPLTGAATTCATLLSASLEGLLLLPGLLARARICGSGRRVKAGEAIAQRSRSGARRAGLRRRPRAGQWGASKTATCGTGHAAMGATLIYVPVRVARLAPGGPPQGGARRRSRASGAAGAALTHERLNSAACRQVRCRLTLHVSLGARPSTASR